MNRFVRGKNRQRLNSIDNKSRGSNTRSELKSNLDSISQMKSNYSFSNTKLYQNRNNRIPQLNMTNKLNSMQNHDMIKSKQKE